MAASKRADCGCALSATNRREQLNSALISPPILQFHKRCQGLVKLCSGQGVLALPRQADCQIRGSECNVTRFADLT